MNIQIKFFNNKTKNTKNQMRKLFTILVMAICFFAINFNVNGATKTASANGSWSSTATWGDTSVPSSSDDIIINTGITVDMDVSFTLDAEHTLTINGTGKIQFKKNVGGTLIINGTIIFNGTSASSITYPDNGQGNSKNSFILSRGATLITANTNGIIGTNCSIESSKLTVQLNDTANYEFNGAAQSTTGLPATVNNLTLSGSGAKTLTSVNVNGTLSMEGTSTTSVTSAITYGSEATLQYKGSSAQTTGTEFITPFVATGGVIINNANSVTLNANKTINSLLKLTSGNLNTGAYTLFFGTSATNPVETSAGAIIGTAVMNSRNVGTASINFLNAYIHSGTDDIGNVVITRKTGTGGIITVGQNSSIACNWYISVDKQPVNGRTLEYSWFSQFDNNKGFSSTNRAQVWTSNNGSSNWVTSGEPIDVSGHDPRTIVNNVTHFSYWMVSSQDAPMPVTLASLTFNVIGRNINLRWSTSSEINNSGFDIERKVSSGDYVKIGFVSGNGTVTTATNYEFTDRNLATGKYSYRLKQIDNNGNFEYFNLNSDVIIGVPSKFKLSQNYPNPFNPSTKINFDLAKDSKVNLKIYDMLGREVSTLVNEFRTAGYYSVDFNASALSSGVYFYRITTEDFSAIKKMVIMK